MALFQFVFFFFCLLVCQANSVCKVFDSISRVDCQHSGLNDISAARMVWLFRKYSVKDMQYNHIRCIRFARSHILLFHNPVDCSCKFGKLILTSCHLEETTPVLLFTTSTTGLKTQSTTQILEHTSTSTITSSVSHKFTLTEQMLQNAHEINNKLTTESGSYNDWTSFIEKDTEQGTSTVSMETISNSSKYHQCIIAFLFLILASTL